MNKRQSVATLISFSLVLLFAGMLALPSSAMSSGNVSTPPCDVEIPKEYFESTMRYSITWDRDKAFRVGRAVIIDYKHYIRVRKNANTISDWLWAGYFGGIPRSLSLDHENSRMYENIMKRCISEIKLKVVIRIDNIYYKDFESIVINPDSHNKTLGHCYHVMNTINDINKDLITAKFACNWVAPPQ